MSARTAWIWLLTAILVSVWLCCNAALVDQPTETDAARATAAAARNVEREGAMLARSKP